MNTTGYTRSRGRCRQASISSTTLSVTRLINSRDTSASYTCLIALIRDRRRTFGGRRCRIPGAAAGTDGPEHLRDGDIPTRLAVGFAASVTTGWRYLRQAADAFPACAGDG